MRYDSKGVKHMKPMFSVHITPLHPWHLIPIVGKTEYDTYFVDWLCFEFCYWVDA